MNCPFAQEQDDHARRILAHDVGDIISCDSPQDRVAPARASDVCLLGEYRRLRRSDLHSVMVELVRVNGLEMVIPNDVDGSSTTSRRSVGNCLTPVVGIEKCAIDVIRNSIC